MRSTVTLAIRKRSSGYRLFACSVDSMDHAHALATLIARSPEYARCFVTAFDAFGEELFSVGLVPAQPSEPPPNGRTTQPMLAAPLRKSDTYVVEAEVIQIPPRLPPRSY